MRAFSLLAAAAVPVLLGASPALAEPGDLWEVTSRMEMQGMPQGMALPARTHKVCASRDWKQPPVANERSECEMVDFQTSATESSWKIRCAGDPPVTGEGQITRTSPDAYTGWMKMTAPQGVMTMTLSGRKVGDCDAAAAREEVAGMQRRLEAQAAAGQKAADDARKASCQQLVEAMDLRLLKMQAATCQDPGFKDALCARLQTPAGFEAVCGREEDPENDLRSLAAHCGKDPQEILQGGCVEALEKESLEVLADCCPQQAQALALRECAGRDYTAMAGSKYRTFCVEYARQGMEERPAAEPEQPATMKQKAKGKLKGLLGR